LKEELEKEAFNDFMGVLVAEAKKTPDSDLAIALAKRPNLNEELEKEAFNDFMAALLEAVKADPDSDLARGFAERPNLKEDLESLVAIPNIASNFETEFNKLDLTVQGQFGTWLDTIFSQVLPKDISTEAKTQIRTEALAYFPQTIRAKIQVGLYCPLPESNSIPA
jgi:hypothetical protein